mmetsp:Transcript_1884/g.3984  ORF Transcript_1884/g.3984 Transcript_1884/m.3984 type:complete len:164 (+) Transcript_1884:508-999(+)
MSGPPPRRHSSMGALDTREALFEALRPVLSDPTLPKAGVGIDDDCIDLWRSTNGAVEVRCRVELGGEGWGGLSKITGALLGLELCKLKKIQMSNWGRPAPLSQRQVTYAASGRLGRGRRPRRTRTPPPGPLRQVPRSRRFFLHGGEAARGAPGAAGTAARAER